VDEGSTNVAIVGIGIHPFGRHPGMTGRAQGAYAVRRALTDAGIGWADVQCAFGGSVAAGGADTLVSDLGLTGLPFINVHNGCGTGGSALAMAERAIRSGDHDVAMAIGFDKHPPGAFNADPEASGLGRWYGETGLMLTTQFFAMKIQRYMHDFDISPRTLARVAAKNYRNGALNPDAFRRQPLSEDQSLESPMVNAPLTQYMFCSPDEGAAAVVLCRAEIAHRYASAPVYLKASVVRTRRLGAFEVHSPWLPLVRTDAPTVDASRAAYEMAGLGPEDVGVVQLQDTDAGAEVIHMAENGFCKDGEQEALLAEGATEIGGSLPVNTDGGLIANGEPIGASGLRQIHELVLQLRGAAGGRQVPGTPRVGYGQLYGAPGTAGVAIVTT
jgi:acetyl-CoA acetyltransferase